MTPEQRFELLALVDGADLERLADAILATGVAITVAAGPEVVTAPIRMPAPDGGSTAVIGHVALSTCTIELDGTRGDACRPGRDLPSAVAAAVCDAEVERNGPVAGDVLALTRLAARDVAAASSARALVIEQTRTDTTP